MTQQHNVMISSFSNISEHNYIQQLAINCIIFGYQDKKLKVLVPKLKFKGDFFSLPSGFIHQDEEIDEAALRILKDRTGISDIYLEQFRVFGKVKQSNLDFLNDLLSQNDDLAKKSLTSIKDFEWFSKRFISIGYYALVDINKVIPTITELDQSIDWYHVKDVPNLIQGFNDMVDTALETLRFNLDHKLTAFSLLPEVFTIKDVQEVYEAVYDKPFARNNFQKKILDLNVLERLEKKYTGAANKAPYLYRLKKA